MNPLSDQSDRTHLPGCTSQSLAELRPDEQKPAHLSDVSWYEVRFERCAKGCPVLQRSLDRGVELAKRFGW